MGQYGDTFGATGGPGLLLLHSPGNTFIRDLQPNQSLLIRGIRLMPTPRSLLKKVRGDGMFAGPAFDEPG